MTIRLPEKTFLDRILKLLGKERQVIIPPALQDLEPQAYIQARYESFWRCLFRRQAQPALPPDQPQDESCRPGPTSP